VTTLSGKKINTLCVSRPLETTNCKAAATLEKKNRHTDRQRDRQRKGEIEKNDTVTVTDR